MRLNPIRHWGEKINSLVTLPQETLVYIIKVVVIVAFATAVVFASVQGFQSWQLYRARSSIDCVVQINRKLSDAIAQASRVEANNEKFFNLVTQLITLGDQRDAAAVAQRQQILQQLNDLQTQRAITEGPAAPAVPTQPKKSSSPKTTISPKTNPTSATTTTSTTTVGVTTSTTQPSLLSPVTSILKLASVQAAVRGNCERSTGSAMRSLRR